MLKFENVSDNILKNINFSIRRGEILKILYTDNTSADNLIGILKGVSHPTEGRIIVNKQPYTVSSISEAQTKGVCFVEENPIETMLFKKLTVMYNLCMPLANKIDWFWLRRKYCKSVKLALQDLIHPTDFEKKISELPSSIQQKIVYCKWLLFSPKVLICIKPFLISDIQVNRVTEQMINLLADKGIAVLIVTSNWPSLNSLKGKTYYLENGKLISR